MLPITNAHEFYQTENSMAAQLPDKVLVDGQWLELYSSPLELYWTRTGRRRPAFYANSNCKRGYIASWELKNNKLLLRRIDGDYRRTLFFFFKRRSPFNLKTLFPKADLRPVKAVWFTGRLRIILGKMVLFEDNGFDSRFEKEQIVTVEKGDVCKIVTVDFANQKLTANIHILR